jgi:hypothetical protein
MYMFLDGKKHIVLHLAVSFRRVIHHGSSSATLPKAVAEAAQPRLIAQSPADQITWGSSSNVA